jgi:hypothetical protein
MSSDEKESTLKDDMLLDVRDLDRAALDQTIIFKKWAEKWAEAVYERDKIKDRIKAKRAELAKAIRANPEKYGGQDGKKISEAWLNSMIDFHDDILELEQELTDAQYNMSMMQIAKEDCEQRSRSLNQLIELYKGQYFSASSRGSVSHVVAFDNSLDKQREKLNNSSNKLTKKLTKKG